MNPLLQPFFPWFVPFWLVNSWLAPSFLAAFFFLADFSSDRIWTQIPSSFPVFSGPAWPGYSSPPTLWARLGMQSPWRRAFVASAWGRGTRTVSEALSKRRVW
jgi:hypothetical protein